MRRPLRIRIQQRHSARQIRMLHLRPLIHAACRVAAVIVRVSCFSVTPPDASTTSTVPSLRRCSTADAALPVRPPVRTTGPVSSITF